MPEYYAEDDELSDTPPEYKNGTELTLAGIITEKTVKTTRRGEKMMFLTLEDSTGEIELIAFPSILEEFSHLLVCDTAVAAFGKLSLKDEDAPKRIISELIPLARNGLANPPEFTRKNSQKQPPREKKPTEAAKPARPSAKRLFIKIDASGSENHKKAIALCSIFSGSTPVIFYDSSKSEYMSEPKITVYPSEYVIRELKSFLGDSSVVLK